MTILHYLLICSTFAYGMFTIQRPGFLLKDLPTFWKKFPKGLHEPLYACGVCTSSIWGGLCFLYLYFFGASTLAWIPVVLVCSTGVTSFIDRAVKAFEKHYGYKPPKKVDPEKQWDYLLPYESLRTMLVNQFVTTALRSGRRLIEVGGYHSEWNHENYRAYTRENRLTRSVLNSLKPYRYDVVILGICFEGDLKILQKLVKYAHTAVIEYSNDGLSRQQVEWITEGLNARLLVPEFEINAGDCDVPGHCGDSISKRRVLLVRNIHSHVKPSPVNTDLH